MSTLLSILLASIFVIAVDFAYSLLSRVHLHRSFPNPLARLLEKLSSSRFFANLKLLTDESCPSCRSANIKRSHRYFFERPLSIFGVWPYRCSDCKARFRKTLGRHFLQPESSSNR
jgi:hypothetical protein